MKSRFQSALETRIDKELVERAMSLVGGTAKDYAAYQYWVGYAAALIDCKSLCEEIEKEFE